MVSELTVSLKTHLNPSLRPKSPLDWKFHIIKIVCKFFCYYFTHATLAVNVNGIPAGNSHVRLSECSELCEK